MSGQKLLLALLGLYLAAGLVIAARRRAAARIPHRTWSRGSADARVQQSAGEKSGPGGGGSLAFWVALFGAWMIGVVPVWALRSELAALMVGIAYIGICLLLSQVGIRLRDRAAPGRLLWLLGPVHAIELAASWYADGRQRRLSRAEQPSSDRGKEVQEALESVVELGETTVGEIMVPRSEIAALEEGADVRAWAAQVQETRHLRVPVYREDLDEVLGSLGTEDLFRRPDPSAAVRGLLSELRFVPESMRCDDLLRDMIAQGDKIAIVVDEFGGTAGLVSDQDLFEILLGEISDQNPFEGRMVRLGERLYLADGHYRIDDFNAWSPAQLPEGDYETLAGYLLSLLGRIPPEGEWVEAHGVALEVAAASERRILKVRIRFSTTLPDSDSGGEAEKAGKAVKAWQAGKAGKAGKAIGGARERVSGGIEGDGHRRG